MKTFIHITALGLAFLMVVLWRPALAAGPVSAQPGDDLVIVVNNDNPLDVLSHIDIEKIFLGKRSFWNGGKRIRTCDLIEPGRNDQKTARAMFSRRYLHKDHVTLKNYWIKMIFSGKGRPPASFRRARDVIEFVSNHPGGIGYVYKENVTDMVKTLAITGMRVMR